MSDDIAANSGIVATVRNHVQNHRDGMVVDLAFALCWVTAVTILFDLLQGPEWAYQLCLLSGVIAYFGFFASLSAAKQGS